MRFIWLTATLVLAVSLPLAATASAGASHEVDSAAIQKLFNDFNDAFNNHDAHTAAALCARNIDWIAITNAMVHDSSQVEQQLNPLFTGFLKAVHRDVKLQEIRFLNPNTAVVIGEYETSGLETPSGAPVPPAKGIYDWVVTKQDGHWLINLWREADTPARQASPP